MHLSEAQLARKRANDREAQRSIRQRTREHIKSLEKKVKELEEQGQSSSMKRVLQRNCELEAERETLKSQLSLAISIPSTTPSELPEDTCNVPKNKINCIPDSDLGWTNMPTEVQPSIRMTSGAYTSETSAYPLTTASMGFGQEHYASTAIPIWNGPQVFGPLQPQDDNLSKLTTWAPSQPAFEQPSRFANLQLSDSKDLVYNPTCFTPTFWQSQPSTYAWQISTKLKSPVTHIDQLMFGVIQYQRHIAMTSGLFGQDLVGPDLPSVNALFHQPGPLDPPSSLAKVMDHYAAVLSNRGFALIPEKLASFMCMYRFVQWQIRPTNDTFKTLHDWQAPRPAQLEIEHPAWMDLPPWGDFREKVIKEQTRYDNLEFQSDYASNLNVNFPYDPMKALVFEDGKITVSKLLEIHLGDIANMSMNKAFADKYPEFKNVCRFEEV